VRDEDVVAQHVAEAGLCDAHREVVVLAVAAAVARGVETAGSLDRGAPDVHAEADRGRQVRVGPRAGVGDGACEDVDRRQLREVVVDVGLRERRDRRVVGKRRDGSDPAVRRRAPRQAVEPARRDLRVGVEEDDVAGGVEPQSPVRRARETEVGFVAHREHRHRRGRREVRKFVAHVRISRGVVDQHEPERRSLRMPEDALDARAELVAGVVDRDDDVDRECIGHGGPSSQTL
jgi:hypothetical protein